MNPQPADRVAARITSYLAAHPQASDTAAGVHQWWLAGTDATIQEVSAALEHLIAIGRVECARQPGGVVFRAKRAG